MSSVSSVESDKDSETNALLYDDSQVNDLSGKGETRASLRREAVYDLNELHDDDVTRFLRTEFSKATCRNSNAAEGQQRVYQEAVDYYRFLKDHGKLMSKDNRATAAVSSGLPPVAFSQHSGSDSETQV